MWFNVSGFSCVFMSFFAVFSQFIYVRIYVLAIEVFYRKPTCLPNVIGQYMSFFSPCPEQNGIVCIIRC